MYSYPSLEFKDDSREIGSAPEDRLYFTGEWTHPSDFATIHGAVEQGFKVANLIVKRQYHPAPPLVELVRMIGRGVISLFRPE